MESSDSEKRLLEGEDRLVTWRGYHGDVQLTYHPSLSALGVRQVTMGAGHWLCLTRAGQVWGQGRNDKGQLGLGHLQVCPEPQLLQSLQEETVVQVACGTQHSGAVTQEGRVYCWGDNSQAQCGVEKADVVSSPAKLSMLETGRRCEHGVELGECEVLVLQIALGAGHSVALSDTGQMWIWGNGVSLGSKEVTTSATPKLVALLQERNVLSICCGHSHILALVEKAVSSRSSTPVHQRLRTSSIDSRNNPSRCEKCKAELYTYTETNDMCIIHGNHVCAGDADVTLDSTLNASFSSSMGTEDSRASPESSTTKPGGKGASSEGDSGAGEATADAAGQSAAGTSEEGNSNEGEPKRDGVSAEGKSKEGEPERDGDSGSNTKAGVVSDKDAQSDSVKHSLEIDEKTPGSAEDQKDIAGGSSAPTEASSMSHESSPNAEGHSMGSPKTEKQEDKKEVVWRRISEEEREKEKIEIHHSKSDVPVTKTSPKVQRSASLLDEAAARKYLSRQFDSEEQERLPLGHDQDDVEGPPEAEQGDPLNLVLNRESPQPSPLDTTAPASPTLPASEPLAAVERKAPSSPEKETSRSPEKAPKKEGSRSPEKETSKSPSKSGAEGKSPLGYILPYSSAMLQTMKSAERALANVGASVADRLSFVTSQVLVPATPSSPATAASGSAGRSGTETMSSSVTSLTSSTLSKETSPSSPQSPLVPPPPQSPSNPADLMRRQSCPPAVQDPLGQTAAELGVRLETEVWVWGQNSKGQLGVGDSLDRSAPTLLRMMSSKHVVKLAAGSTHSLALTANSHVYSWGNNGHGQLGHSESHVTPNRLKFMKGCSVWDVAAGDQHSLFLADSSGMEPDVFFCGRHPVDGVYAPVHTTKVPTALSVVKKEGWVRSVMAGGDDCASLVEVKATPMMAAVFQFAASERAFYQHLNRVITAFLGPLKKTNFYTTVDVFPYSRCLKGVCSGFSVLTRKVGQCLVELTERMRGRGSVLEAHVFTQAEVLGEEFAKYSRLFSDALAVGAFPYSAKGAASFFETLETFIPDLVQNKGFDRKNHAGAFQATMRYPFQRLSEYAHWLNKIVDCLPEDSVEAGELKKAVKVWETLRVATTTDHHIASKTQAFWDSVSVKISDPLRLPERRLLRDSKTHPLVLHSAGRFSSHLFLLFSDVFVHVQNVFAEKSTSTQIFPLETVWVEAAGNAEGGELQPILITTPEDILLVTASTAAEKAEWLMALNSAINKVLGGQRASSSSRRGSMDRLTPRVMRHARHKFQRPGPFQGASYNGSWASGKVHGFGELAWSDGKKYVGNFYNGLQEGHGVYTEVKGEGQVEVHEGNWKDGKLSGFATIKYASGDSYQGYFKDGQRFGHGVLRQGRHTSTSASVYVGEWLHDRRHGYGVHDDVLKGEKYMGQWADDVRCGRGVLVTLDGMYFEGHFSGNRMAGQGLMLTDDNCCYEGEFQGITQLQGRGTLTLSNGDKIEGTFSGSLDEGLKISGTFLKSQSPPSPERRGASARPKAKNFGKLSVPAERKWEDLFRHCCATLGYQGGATPDCERAWEVVAVAVTQGRKSLKELKEKSPNKAKLCAVGLEGLETIPPHNLPCLTPAAYLATQQYLAKAFEMSCHPLGALMDKLVDVFRATYVGVGAHPRLLSHAVREVQSFVVRLYAVIRVLFPELPERTSAVQIFASESEPSSPSASPLESPLPPSLDLQDSGMVVSAAGLLSPILLPKLYPPLFDLYALHFDLEDDRYWERVVRLNRQGDMALMSFLGVPQKYWLMDEMLKHCQSENLSSLKDQCYASAVDKLQHISSALSPMEKMLVVEGAFLEITVTVQGSLGGQHTWCMDDLFPIFQFVVVRAKIRHLGAEVALVEDLMEKHLEHGELGLMVTTLKACYYQILNEKMPNH